MSPASPASVFSRLDAPVNSAMQESIDCLLLQTVWADALQQTRAAGGISVAHGVSRGNKLLKSIELRSSDINSR